MVASFTATASLSRINEMHYCRWHKGMAVEEEACRAGRRTFIEGLFVWVVSVTGCKGISCMSELLITAVEAY